jgi:hypothetical protein
MKGGGKFVEFADVNKLKTKKDRYTRKQIFRSQQMYLPDNPTLAYRKNALSPER